MPPAQDSAAAEPKPTRLALVVISACTMLATLTQALDGTIANVALPYMQGTVSASQEQINWVLTSYIIAAAIMTAPTGYIAARFGRTRVFVISIVGFTSASVLCGLAQSLPQIVMFRLLQGLFGASLVPLSQSVLLDIYPPERRGAAMALWGMGVQIGPVLGPVLGGWLTETHSWRWVFYINVPVGVVAATGLSLMLKETRKSRGLKLDWIGFGALSLGIGALQLMLDRGETLDWFNSREIILEACLAGLGFYLFTVQSALARQPFLTPKLFADLNFMLGCAIIFFVGAVLYSTLALLAPYVQTLMNYPVVTAGVVLAPRGAGTIVSLVVCGRLAGRVSPRIQVAFGVCLTAYALYQMMRWTPDASEAAIIRAGLLQGLGIGFVFAPLTLTTFSTLAAPLRTEAAGIFSLMRNLGSAIGISVTGALLQNNIEVNHAILTGVATPFNRVLQSGAGLLMNPATARGRALFNGEVTRQASIIAYSDDFKLMLALSFLVLPMAFLLRGAAPPAAAPVAAVEQG